VGMKTSLLSAAAAAMLVLAVVACGGGKSTTSTAAGGTTAEAWANGVCSSFTTWKSSLEKAKTDFTSQPSPAQLQKAGQDIEQATQTLAQSLKQLGTPETAQGQAAKQSLDTLATSLENGMNKINQELKSGGGILSQVTTIGATLTTMANSLKLAGSNLKSLAPGADLEHAFQQASACQKYVHS
jgi:exonuclease VII large subunit